MTGSVATILRHPLKSIGREALEEVILEAGKWLPFDRKWAVAHERSKLDGDWGKKVNFLRGVAAPSLWPIDLPAPTGLYKAASAHLTDVPDPWISIATTASLKALSHRVGMKLSPHRFRGNLWLDGTDPWEEMNWVGKRLQIGEVVLDVKEQITRCKATMANPETGKRDAIRCTPPINASLPPPTIPRRMRPVRFSFLPVTISLFLALSGCPLHPYRRRQNHQTRLLSDE